MPSAQGGIFMEYAEYMKTWPAAGLCRRGIRQSVDQPADMLAGGGLL